LKPAPLGGIFKRYLEHKNMSIKGLLQAARELSASASRLAQKFTADPSFPARYIYNPLDYAFPVYEAYVRRYGAGKKRSLFSGMNPGPFGMAQTGVPFGEVEAVKGWLGLSAEVGKPAKEHPKRPVDGFACKRSEVSGRRFWGLMKERFGTAESFFATAWVDNYCPLVFMAESGANITPDKIPARFREELFSACDKHLERVISETSPQFCVGIGGFAAGRFRAVLGAGGPPHVDMEPHVYQLLHPSPASPAANKGWALAAAAQLVAAGIWEA
jgi:single-strand selective monofunctional uracil DNA glycosylase